MQLRLVKRSPRRGEYVYTRLTGLLLSPEDDAAHIRVVWFGEAKTDQPLAKSA